MSLEWSEIPGYGGRYEACRYGMIRNSKNKRILTQNLHRTGYYIVGISPSKGEASSARLVHSLIAKTFIGPRPEGHDVHHRDGDKINNHTDNLEYISRGDHNKIHHNDGSPVLTDDEVKAILLSYPGRTQADLAREYGVASATINAILVGDTYTHVKILPEDFEDY